MRLRAPSGATWEWHADNLLAYLFWSLEQRARETLPRRESDEMVEALREIALQAWGDEPFDYLLRQNA